MHKLQLVIGIVITGICSTSVAADDNAPERPNLESLDSNGDGVISFVEFQESDIDALARLDTDQNDVLTLDEFLNARPMRGPRSGNRGGDQNGDANENSERRERMQERMAERMTEQFNAMDTDGDEIVTLAEFQEANFDRRDRDGDGVLNEEELQPPGRGGRRGPGGRGGPRGQNGGQSPSI
ncbi:MAG: hypothetical protein GKR91_11810 [Pseudomonadales bacterium]|nr:hypothetical protein [Pseudomonadales bacterium]